MIRGRNRVIGLQGEQSQIKNIVVFIGIQVRRTAQIGLGLGYFAPTSSRDRQIVQNFRQVRAGNHVRPQGVLQRNEDFLGAIRLTQEQADRAEEVFVAL